MKKVKNFNFNYYEIKYVRDLPDILKKHSPWVLDSYLTRVKYGKLNPINGIFKLTLDILPRKEKK